MTKANEKWPQNFRSRLRINRLDIAFRAAFQRKTLCWADHSFQKWPSNSGTLLAEYFLILNNFSWSVEYKSSGNLFAEMSKILCRVNCLCIKEFEGDHADSLDIFCLREHFRRSRTFIGVTCVKFDRDIPNFILLSLLQFFWNCVLKSPPCGF